MDKLENLLAVLDSYGDEYSKADALIELSDQFETAPTEIASAPYPASNKVPACESEVYIFHKINGDNSIKYYFAVLNPQGISAKAFAVILDTCLSNVKLEIVAKVDDDIIKRIFGNGISMGKGMGLRSMLGVVKAIANNNLRK
jgi:cysteine desulfuration protein SufE